MIKCLCGSLVVFTEDNTKVIEDHIKTHHNISVSHSSPDYKFNLTKIQNEQKMVRQFLNRKIMEIER
jgi:hypothetical protein